MLNDPVLTEAERVELCVMKGQVIGDPYSMCEKLSKIIRDLRDQVTVGKGTYNTMDVLYSDCQAERLKLRARISELEVLVFKTPSESRYHFV